MGRGFSLPHRGAARRGDFGGEMVSGKLRAWMAAVALAVCTVMQPAVAHADGEASFSVSGNRADAAAAAAGVFLDAGGDAAVLDGCPFALESFSRAQVGGHKVDDDNGYLGYAYYAAGRPGNVSVVLTESYAVVYVSPETAAQADFDMHSEGDAEGLVALLMSLDEWNSKGGALVRDAVEWVFVFEPSYERDGVLFLFDQELKEGQFYTVVVGADGGDITDAAHPAHVVLAGVDTARMVAADAVAVATAPEGLAAFAQFLGSIDMSPLWVTLKTTGVAIVFVFVLGLAAAYFSLRLPARAQDLVDSAFTIPMVLPPTVCGFLLLLALGRNTALGEWFIGIGFPLVFSWPATVIAATVVAFPLMYRSARGAFEGLDANMLDAARTLGWGNAKIFFKLMLPLSWSSIAAGTVLALARALGEFGATLFLAGNYLGVTRTIPIAIYFEWMNGNIEVALFWTVVIMVFCFLVILFINLWSRRTTKYRRRDG